MTTIKKSLQKNKKKIEGKNKKNNKKIVVKKNKVLNNPGERVSIRKCIIDDIKKLEIKNLTEKNIKKIVESIKKTVVKKVKEGKNFNFTGLFSVTIKHLKPTKMTFFDKGEIKLPARDVIRVKVSEVLKKVLN